MAPSRQRYFRKLAAWNGQERKPSKRSNGVKLNSLQVVENMERETRIELATNSLEDCTYIENKG